MCFSIEQIIYKNYELLDGLAPSIIIAVRCGPLRCTPLLCRPIFSFPRLAAFSFQDFVSSQKGFVDQVFPCITKSLIALVAYCEAHIEPIKTLDLYRCTLSNNRQLFLLSNLLEP